MNNEVSEIIENLPIQVNYFEATCICGNKIQHDPDFSYEDVEDKIIFGSTCIEVIEICDVCESEIEFTYTCEIEVEVVKTEASVIKGPKNIDGRLIDDIYYGKEINLPNGTHKTLFGSVWIENGIITTIFSHHDKKQLELELN